MRNLDLTAPPALVRQDVTLEALASKINSAHEAGERTTRQSLEHYRACGDALVKAREEVRARKWKWVAWLREHVRCFGVSRSYQLIRFAEEFPQTGKTEDAEELWRKINSPGGGEESAGGSEVEAKFALTSVDAASQSAPAPEEVRETQPPTRQPEQPSGQNDRPRQPSYDVAKVERSLVKRFEKEWPGEQRRAYAQALRRAADLIERGG